VAARLLPAPVTVAIPAADDPDRPDGELTTLAAVDLRRDDGFSVSSTRSDRNLRDGFGAVHW